MIRRKDAPPYRPATQSTYTPRPRAKAVAQVDTRDKLVMQVPKADVVRDEGYRRLVATLKCINCGVVGRTQCAHANSPASGKGLSLKADDREVLAGAGGAVRVVPGEDFSSAASMRPISRAAASGLSRFSFSASAGFFAR